MKFEIELENYNSWNQYKLSAITDVLARAFGGHWKIKVIPSDPVAYPADAQVNDYVQVVMDKAEFALKKPI